MTRRDTASSSNPDIRRAWRALCDLANTRNLPTKPPTAPDAMTELLFDHVLQFDSSRFLYLLTNLQIDRMDIAARAHCSERSLFLDPSLLAEETLCVLFQRSMDGERIRPFAEWARVSMDEAATDAVEQPDLAAPRDLGKSPQDRALIQELAPSVNRLDQTVRRILWHHLVDGSDAHQIARTIDGAFEHVEFILARLVEPARRALQSKRSQRKPRRTDDSDASQS